MSSISTEKPGSSSGAISRASEGSVDVSFYREKFLTSLWAGEGALSLQTRVRGSGQVAYHHLRAHRGSGRRSKRESN